MEWNGNNKLVINCGHYIQKIMVEFHTVNNDKDMKGIKLGNYEDQDQLEKSLRLRSK